MRMKNSILDSGNRTVFPTGGVRDLQDDKGRVDLVPLVVIADLIEYKDSLVYGTNTYANILRFLDSYKETKDKTYLQTAIVEFCKVEKMSLIDMTLEVSIHYRDGAKKYEEDNWKGLPLKSFLSSGSRHLLKHMDGHKDERHDRAFIWNVLGALWIIDNKPELIDAPFEVEEKGNENERK